MLYTLSKAALLPREVCFTAVSIPKGCGAGTGSFLVSGSSAELLGWKVSPLPRLSLARFSHTTTFAAVLTMSGLVNRFVTVPEIGRASCRERVQISVGSACVKDNNKIEHV